MKNICKTIVKGKPMFLVHLTIRKGKRIKRYFNTESEAKLCLKELKAARTSAAQDLLSLPVEEIADIMTAKKKLPMGYSLTEIVVEFNKTHALVKLPLNTAFEKYQEHLKSLNYGKLPNLRIYSFFKEFKSWNDATPNEVLAWLRERGAPKTIKEYRSELKKFYDWSKRRGYCGTSPIDKIATADLPRIERADCTVWELADLKIFFDFLKECRPQYLNWFAIACFAGIRRAEINRLKPAMFDLQNKRITLPYNITKTEDTWEMSNLPENLWDWLNAYGVEIHPIVNSTFGRLTNAFEKWYKKNQNADFKWGHNICRHSFCTYHLSLHRDPVRTSLLLKHRSPDTMWQHYLARLVSAEEAQKYFEIKPKKVCV